MSLYIHQLKDLTPKSADIESTFIVRDIKKKTPPPLTYEKIFDYFSLFFVSESEKAKMAGALELIEPTISEIIALAGQKDPDFEPINLKRAVEMLHDIPQPLTLNANYLAAICIWQEDFTQDFAPLMNKLPLLSDAKEKVQVNNQLNAIFQRLLRNDHMAFNYMDLVNEAQRNRMSDLYDSMETGFFFKVSLEDELKKLDFQSRKMKLPDAKLRAVDDLKQKIKVIKAGVDAAYDANVRMVNWALVVYAYIKMMTAK
jgi:hypothetical protein